MTPPLLPDLLPLHPHLTAKGIESPDSLTYAHNRAELTQSTAMYNAVVDHLLTHGVPSGCCYGAKHEFERATNYYVNLGSYIAACLALGAQLRRVNPPNAYL